MNRSSLLRLFVVFTVVVTGRTSPGEAPQPRSTILFLCPYGGAKSVMAASYFNQFMSQHGLPLMGVAAAAEEPYGRVPPPVAALLAQEGIDVSKYQPRRVESGDVLRALRIVAIDCDLTKAGLNSLSAERWDDVPKVSEDLPGAASAIRRHVERLVQEMAESASSRPLLTDEAGAPEVWSSSTVRTCVPP